ncbi:MAG: hypothetical protein NTW86_00155 [Candidatus Sumerlaeota bacterium]|nr:hypothetical protein [Candidatus Sumerlaeota bacterium]
MDLQWLLTAFLFPAVLLCAPCGVSDAVASDLPRAKSAETVAAAKPAEKAAPEMEGLYLSLILIFALAVALLFTMLG